MNERDVLALKRRVDDEYRKDQEAIERVLRLLREKKEQSASQALPTTGTSDRTPKRVRGIQQLIGGFAAELPPVFNREDVLRKLQEVAPQKAAAINLASLRNTLRTLVINGLIEIVEKSSGTRGATYRVVAPPGSENSNRRTIEEVFRS